VIEALTPLEPRLDGGWGVDALLGEQTRAHDDVDIVIARRDAHTARALLEPLGFEHDLTAAPGLPARLVLRDPSGRQVDLHLIVRDTAGLFRLRCRQAPALPSSRPGWAAGWGMNVDAIPAASSF